MLESFEILSIVLWCIQNKTKRAQVLCKFEATIILKFNFELDPTNSWEAGETFGNGEIFRKGDPDEFWTQSKTSAFHSIDQSNHQTIKTNEK